MSAHLSSMKLDAFAIGSLAPGELSLARAHLDGCARCRGELEAIEASHAKFSRDVFPRTVPRVRARMEARPWFQLPRWLYVAVPAGAVAMLAVFFVRQPPPAEHAYLGVKGGAAMQVFARTNNQVRAVKDGATLAPGDELRFVVAPAGKRFLLVASVDAAGNANVYYPFDGAASMALPPEPRVELPDSIVLDEAPGPERVFALFSDAPLNAHQVTEQLRQLAAGGPAKIREARSLPVEGAAQLTFVFEKTTP